MSAPASSPDPSASPTDLNPVEDLTPREAEILALLAARRTDREIARELFISLGTVKWYNQQIYDKLGVRGRRKVVERAIALGLLGETEPTRVFNARNPFKGLQAFQESDEADFFGREALVERLVSRLKEEGPYARFLAVVGPSGCGKSSVVKAGLIPALRQDAIPGSSHWTILQIVPGSHPFDEIEIAFSRVEGNSTRSFREPLCRDGRGLLRAARLLNADNGQQILLVIDQFEELFTLVQDQRKTRLLLDCVYTAITASRSPVRVVITLRADFYDRPLRVAGFSELVRERTEVVVPMTPAEIEKAITSPARRVGVEVPSTLLAALVSDVADQHGLLPMLQYTLTELFDLRDGQSLSMHAYEQLGGVGGALAQHVEGVYADLSADEQAAARQIFLRLVTLGEGAADMRRRVLRSELVSAVGDATDSVLDAFDLSRLLMFDRDPVVGEPTVELTHEAIITEWPRLQTWLNESRDDVRQGRLLSHAAEEWAASGFEDSYLLQGARLQQYADWGQETRLAQTDLEQRYLDESLAEAQRRRNRRRRIRNLALVSSATVAVVMGLLALWANFQRHVAEAAEHEARRQASIGLASMALRELETGHQEQAVLLALEALVDYPYTAQAESALADAVAAFVPYVVTDVTEKRVYRWSPDGSRIALGGAGGWGQGSLYDEILLFASDNIEADAALASYSLEVPDCTVREMAWVPAGDRIVSTYMRGPASTAPCFVPPTVWDVATGEVVVQFAEHSSETGVLGLSVAPDGAAVLTTGEDGTARIWDAETGVELLTITGHRAAVTDGAWSPAGDRFATASLDGSVRVWTVAEGRELYAIANEPVGVTGVDWSLDGTLLAAALEDGMARIYDAETGEIVLTLTGHDGALSGVAFDPAGGRIATASSMDGTARIWDAVTGEAQLILPGFGVELRDVVWSPDGSYFTVNGSRHFRFWDVSARSLNLSGHTMQILDGEWSPDGTLIATSSFDGTARIWDAASGELWRILEHGNRLWYLDWSPDSTRIVTTSGDGIARIWDVSSGELVTAVQFAEPGTVLFAVRWSPDGAHIISSDLTSHAVVWDADTGEIVSVLDFDAARALLGPEGFCVLFGPAWSPNSQRISTGCPVPGVEPGTGVLVWDAETGDLLKAFEPLYDGVARTDWSPDGRRIVAANGSTASDVSEVTVWDAETGELLQTFAGHSDFCYGLSWSPDGSRVASGDMQGVVKVWDPVTGAEVLGFEVPGIVTSVHWHPAGTHLIVTGEFVPPIIRRVWPSTRVLVDYASACCVGRMLSSEERARFGLPAYEPR